MLPSSSSVCSRRSSATNDLECPELAIQQATDGYQFRCGGHGADALTTGCQQLACAFQQAVGDAFGIDLEPAFDDRLLDLGDPGGVDRRAGIAALASCNRAAREDNST